MIRIAPVVINELGVFGTTEDTHIKLRVVTGRRGKFLGEFDMVSQASDACQPDTILNFLMKHDGKLADKVKTEGVILFDVPYSPEQLYESA